MNSFLCFLKENKRFIAAVTVNFIALCFSIWWFIDSNFIHWEGRIEIEPLVTTAALSATLLGLNYVNEKLGKPDLRFKIEQSFAQPPMGVTIHGLSVELQNHSIFKCHVKRFYVTMPKNKQIYQILKDGYSGEIVRKISLEPGEAFSFHLTKEEIFRNGATPSDFEDLIAEDDVDRTYVANRNDFRTNIESMYKIEK